MICGDSIRWETRQSHPPSPLSPPPRSNFLAQTCKKSGGEGMWRKTFNMLYILDYISSHRLTGMDFCYRRHQSGSLHNGPLMCCCDTGGGARQKFPIFLPREDLSSKISPRTYHNPGLSYYRAYFTKIGMKGNEILFQGSTTSNQPPLGEEDKDDTTRKCRDSK